MRKLIQSLAAAAAATAALSIIPLALASGASASTTSPAPVEKYNTNWAGYVDVPASGQAVAEVYATFVVPKINCAKSVIGPHEASAAFRKANGNDWSAISYWVGIDGQGGQSGYLEQIGVVGICASKTSAAVYKPFWQINPRVNHNMTLSNGDTVKAGDTIHVAVIDEQMGSNPYNVKRGHTYELDLVDSTQYAGYWEHMENTSGTAPDASADYVTEAVSGGPNVAKNAVGLAATATVHWDHALIATFKSGGAYPLNTFKKFWTAQEWFVVKALATQMQIYIGTTSLSQDAAGYSVFANTWAR